MTLSTNIAAEIEIADIEIECLIEDRIPLQAELAAAERRVAEANAAFNETRHEVLAVQNGEAAADLLPFLESVCEPIARGAALYYLAYQAFPDPQRPRKNFVDAIDMYGPAGRLSEHLKSFDWPEGLRPSWAKKNPSTEQRREPMPGTFAMIEELRAEIGA